MLSLFHTTEILNIWLCINTYSLYSETRLRCVCVWVCVILLFVRAWTRKRQLATRISTHRNTRDNRMMASAPRRSGSIFNMQACSGVASQHGARHTLTLEFINDYLLYVCVCVRLFSMYVYLYTHPYSHTHVNLTYNDSHLAMVKKTRVRPDLNPVSFALKQMKWKR